MKKISIYPGPAKYEKRRQQWWAGNGTTIGNNAWATCAERLQPKISHQSMLDGFNGLTKKCDTNAAARSADLIVWFTDKRLHEVFGFYYEDHLTGSIEVDSELNIAHHNQHISKKARLDLWHIHTKGIGAQEDVSEAFEKWEKLIKDNKRLEMKQQLPLASLRGFLRFDPKQSDMD